MKRYVRSRGKSLGLIELIAIALGGMVGGGIFTILGISASLIGYLTPIAIALGGIVAGFAAYSYVKLGLYYKDEGATYAFFKRTYPDSSFSAAAIGWFTIFGYISTLALYAYTFASYAISSTSFADDMWMRKIVAWSVIALFTGINLISVKGMGRVEDLMVYTKLFILTLISVVLIQHGQTEFPVFLKNMAADANNSGLLRLLIVASITFVAYEGFQLVINAVNEMKSPEKNIPRAIYTAIFLALLIYLIISIGALMAIPLENLVRDKEYALAAGAENILGRLGAQLVILGAVLATSSAISGTVFGSSRQMAEIAEDGYFPAWLAQRTKSHIPNKAILAMSVTASLLILIGGLQLILEFGSITFLLVSFLMATANFKIREKTHSSAPITVLALTALGFSGLLILYYEFKHKPEQMFFIILLYFLLTLGAWAFAKYKDRNKAVN